jgi:BASS family bile acid:Na+ symporter
MIGMATAGVAAGHWLGGPEPSDRAIFAIGSAMRHPGIAIAVASANVPQEQRLAAAILLYVLVSFAITSFYGVLIRRRHPVSA